MRNIRRKGILVLAIVASVTALSSIAIVAAKEAESDRIQGLLETMASDNRKESEFAAITLARAGDARSLPKLEQIMESGSIGMKALVIKEVVNIDGPRVAEILLLGTKDEEDKHIRISALSALRDFADKEKVKARLLEAAAIQDDIGDMCIDVLGEGKAKAGKELVELFDSQPKAKFSRKRRMIRAMGRIADEEAISKLKVLSESEEDRIANEAKKALATAREGSQGHSRKTRMLGGEDEFFRRGRNYGSVVASLVLAYNKVEDKEKSREAREAIDTILKSPDKKRFIAGIKDLTKDSDKEVAQAAQKTLEYCEGIVTGQGNVQE